MNFNKNYKTLLLDPHAKKFALDERVNLILSPSLYWVKKLSLPLKKASEVKRVLPSLFEDTLPKGEYNYYVYKEGEEFFAFAYDDRKILELIEQKGLSSSNVKNIYFAQSELGFIDGAVKINETQSIYKKDDILILLPCCWIDEKGALDLEGLTHSKYSISLTQYGHIIDSASVYKIVAILALFVILVLGENYMIQQKVNLLDEKKESEFTRHHLKATMFENRSILKKYKTIYNTQTKLRQAMSTILSLRGVTLKSVSRKKGKLIAEFEKLPDSIQKRLKEKLKKKKLSFNFISQTRVEVAL
jgi:hypothetical protein